jgi:hypothetical protein
MGFNQNDNNAKPSITESVNDMHMRIHKKYIIDELMHYKRSRFGLLTFLFRDRKLTQEKIKMTNDIINFVRDYTGDKQGLINELKVQIVENCNLSINHGKYHYNLDNKNMIPTKFVYHDVDGHPHDYIENRPKVEPGQSSRMSGLANTLHNAIEYITNEVDKNIRFKFAGGKL